MHLSKWPVLLVFILSVASTNAASWQTDIRAAKAQAKREGKTVLVNFTGSDWCGWCIKLKQEVFSQPQFDAYANKHLVLVEIDFPRRTAQSPAVKKANSELAKIAKVSGFPTVLLMDSDGFEIGRCGYVPGGPAAFIKETSALMGTRAPATTDTAASKPTHAAPPPATFAGARTFPPQRYTNLVLKSISGTTQRRFALVNNHTFAQGETASVKLLDRDVQVHCVEIRSNAVVVAVKGEPTPRELALRR
jgi:protein disulfide-isomerase